ncbi:MAG TPA: DUF58 domain-containing protein [Planctomycetota bacterium]|nr:DUF58 domain-containing protein [Planctomycetota bacterium]
MPRLGRQGGLELVARRVLEGLYAGRHRSAFHGSSIDFAEHRPYQPGDEVRAIDWRAFARTDRLLIRCFHDDRQLPLALMLDTSASMAYGEPTKHETAILAAAALGLLAIDQGDSVRVLAGSTSEWTGDLGGAMGATRVAQVLETTKNAGVCDLAATLKSAGDLLTRRSLIVLFSDLLCEIGPLIPAVANLAARGHDVAVIQVLDRTELALPPEWGRVTMTDPEGREAPFSCDTAVARTSFDEAMAAHLAECRSALSGARADHQVLVSDEDLAQVLSCWLQRRRRR